MMPRPNACALAMLLGLACASMASAQERAPAGPEFDLLARLAGEYTYDFSEVGSPMQKGRLAFEPFAGGRFLKFQETLGLGTADAMGIMGIVGYDDVGGYFTWYRVFDNGAYEHARGTLEHDTITFKFTETRWEPWGEDSYGGPGREVRTKWTDFSPDGFTFIWERSVDGGPWKRLSEGHNKRVR